MNTPLQSVTVDGLRLAYLDAGSGPAVLLLHGFPDSHEVWREQVPALVAAGFRVIAPDLRGFGETDAPDGRQHYTIDLILRDLLGLLDRLGLPRVKLVGHDWGAVIGWFLAARHPARVERYAALSVGHPSAYAHGGLKQKLKGWYVLFFQIPWLPERLAVLDRWRSFRMLIDFDAEMDAIIARMARPGRLTAGINYYRANLAKVLVGDACPTVKVPVLGLWSDGDRFLDEGQMRDCSRYVDAPFRYARIDGVNHWLQLTAAPRVNALLLDFLR